MKRILIAAFALMSLANSATAQKFYTKNATFSFDGTADKSPESIKASCNTSTVVVDAASGKVEASVQMKGFHFKNALMESHFNENYMQSAKFPKATFNGAIEGWKAEFLKKDGAVNVIMKGTMTMHGVTKNVEIRGVVTVKGGAIVGGTASFSVVLADYQIDIPAQNLNTISKKVKIEIKMADMKRM